MTDKLMKLLKREVEQTGGNWETYKNIHHLDSLASPKQDEELWEELILEKENELKRWKAPTMVDGSTYNNYDRFAKDAIPKLQVEISQLKYLKSKYSITRNPIK